MASRFVTTASAAISGARTATSRSRKPSVEHDADQRAASSGAARCARSWFSAAWPPTRAPGGSAARRRSIVRPTAGLDGSALGIACTSARPPRPGLRSEHAGDAGIAPGGRRHGSSLALRRGDLERSRRAGAEGPLHLLVADPGAVALGDDLDRRHAGLQPEDRQREHDEHERRGRTEHVRLAPEPLAPARRARRAVLPRSAPSAAAARRPSGRASRARRAAGSASPRARRRR